MNVIVFGSTGRTGRLVVDHALRQGHDVSAFTRSAGRLDEADPALSVAVGDVMDPGSVAEALVGQDAAIVALGGNNLRDRSTISSGTRNVVAGMSEHGGGRLVVLSSAGVGESWSQVSLLAKVFFNTLLRNTLADHTAQEEIVMGSSLAWTIVRSAVLNDQPAGAEIRASNEGKTGYISRADLARFLVEQLDGDEYLNQAISVTS